METVIWYPDKQPGEWMCRCPYCATCLWSSEPTDAYRCWDCGEEFDTVILEKRE